MTLKGRLRSLRELRRGPVPDRVRLRVAVQQEQRRACPALNQIDRRAARPDALALEAWEEPVQERNSLPCMASDPDLPGTEPSAISLRGRFFRSSVSARARKDTSS